MTNEVSTQRKVRANLRLVAGIAFVALMMGIALVIANAPSREVTAQVSDTVVVTRGSITATVTGIGTISAEDTVELSFQTNGTVKGVLVEEGDTVAVGQVLARLDDRLLQVEVTSAQAKLASAKAKLSKTKAGAYDEEIASAKASIQKAQAAYDLAVKEAESLDLDLAAQKLAMDKAKVSVDTAQASYDRIGGASNPSIGMTQQSKDLQNATLEYQNAKAKYEALLKTSASNRTSKVESTKASIERAKADLATLQVRTQDVSMDQASVDQSEQSLKQAQINLEYATLKAPFAGVITAVNVVTGTRTTNTPIAIKMMNPNPLRINLKLSENNVVKVELNQPVKLTTDSLKDWEAQGTVSYLAPSGESVSGVVTYLVKVSFTLNDTRIKVGMTANVDITTAQRNNVLIVPNSALLPKGTGKVVQVVTSDGKAEEAQVQIGLSDGTQTEIISGVAEGTRIVALPGSSKPKSSGLLGLMGGGRP